MARNGYDGNEGEEDRMNRREAAIRNLERREETIWHKNNQQWGIAIKYDRKRKQMSRYNEKSKWETRLAHGGASRSEAIISTNTNNCAAMTGTKQNEPLRRVIAHRQLREIQPEGGWERKTRKLTAARKAAMSEMGTEERRITKARKMEDSDTNKSLGTSV